MDLEAVRSPRRIFREALALYEASGYVARVDPRVMVPGDVVLSRSL